MSNQNINIASAKPGFYASAVLFLLYLFFAGIAVTNERLFSYISPGILALMGLFLLLTESRPWWSIYFAVVVVYVLLMCGITPYNHGSTGHIELAGMILLTLPCFFSLRHAHLRLRQVMPVFWLSSVIACVTAVYGKFVLSEWLPEEFARSFSLEARYIAVILISGTIMTMALFCYISVTILLSRKRYRQALIYAAGALAGIFASLLTGSRGTWLCLPPVMLALLWCHRRRPTVWLYTGVTALFLAVAALSPQTGIVDRVLEGANDVRMYTEAQEDGSIGARFQIWRSAIVGIGKKPLTGWGDENWNTMNRIHYEQGIISYHASQLAHTHNQFLDHWVKLGFFPFLLLLAMFLIPAYIFFSQRKKTPIISSLGMTHVFATFTYCLSDNYLSGRFSTMFYAFTVILLMALIADHDADESGLRYCHSDR